MAINFSQKALMAITLINMMDHQISDNFSLTINTEKSLKKWRFFRKT